MEKHLKEIEEEVKVDEKNQLLEDKHKNIVIDKDYKINGELIYNNDRRPSSFGENAKDFNFKKVNSNTIHEINGIIIYIKIISF